MRGALVSKFSRLTVIAIAAAMSLGCPDSSKKKQQVAGKPALELRKAVSFVLASPGLPSTKNDLVTAIVTGLKNSVKLDDKIQTIQADGTTYPSLQKLQVDLTNTQLDTGKKPVKLKSKEPIAQGITADQFVFRAAPMKIDGGAINLNIQAREVNLGLLHDRAERPVLALSSARDGSVDCQTTTDDLSKIFRASANERGKAVGLSVRKTQLTLKSQNDRDLSADIRFASVLLLVPIQLHFTAHVTVDEDGNATLSNLTCDGDDAAGSLITTFIRPVLKDYDNKTMPLVAFPTPDVHLRNVAIHLNDQTVHLTANFGK